MRNIREFLESRFSTGVIVEGDFSQLEIYALAILSGDKQLKEDLLSGKDLHKIRAAEMFKKPESRVSGAERRIAKVFSFQLQYGSGAKNMAKGLGVDVKLAQDFIHAYYNRYPNIRTVQDLWKVEVKSNARYVDDARSKSGIPVRTGHVVTTYGKRYTFREKDIPWSPGDVNFSPTEIVNYPVQGLAADILHCFLGILGEELIGQDSILPIGSVHDSVIFDVRNGLFARRLMEGVLPEAMGKLPSRMESSLEGFSLALPLFLEVSYGPTWAAQDKYCIIDTTGNMTYFS